MHDLPLSGRGDDYLIGPRQAWFAFAMTIALMIFDYVDRQIIVSLFPHLKAEWGLSDTQLGTLVSAVSVTVALAGIPVALFADRVSAETMRANQMRLYLSTMAYVLVSGLRRLGLKATELAEAQVSTIRTKLLKIGAQIRVTVRKVWVSMSSSYPWQDLFQQVWTNLRC